MEELSQRSPNVDFLKIDIDELPDVAEELDVSSVPTFIFYRNQAVFQRIVGANRNKIEEVVRASS